MADDSITHFALDPVHQVRQDLLQTVVHVQLVIHLALRRVVVAEHARLDRVQVQLALKTQRVNRRVTHRYVNFRVALLEVIFPMDYLSLLSCTPTCGKRGDLFPVHHDPRNVIARLQGNLRHFRVQNILDRKERILHLQRCVLFVNAFELGRHIVGIPKHSLSTHSPHSRQYIQTHHTKSRL